MKTPYSFSILRYIHDPVTHEFVNIGVALYSPEAGFLRSICTTHYARITQLFTKITASRSTSWPSGAALKSTRRCWKKFAAIARRTMQERPFVASTCNSDF